MPTHLLSAQELERLKKYCEELKEYANEVFHKEICYDDASILWLSSIIESFRDKPNGPTKKKIAERIGSFLGEAMIARDGGEWVVTDEKVLGIRSSAGTIVFPFGKVLKQFKNGTVDSIWGIYQMGQSLESRNPRV